VTPFRFMASMPVLDGHPQRWRDQVRHLEDLGFSSVAISDHVTGGWSMEPVVMMTAAALATSRLRVVSAVLANDFRHPVLLHRALANLDVLSGGRVEIGLGAGWLRADYDAAGLPFDPPGVRIDRLGESIAVIKALFAGGSVSHTGRHYTVADLPGVPAPVQRPHPPLLVGGGGRRVLELAGQTADIVGINPRMAAGAERGAAVLDLTEEQVTRKVGWARAAAVAAGRDPERLEFQLSLLDVRVRQGTAEHVWTSSLARSAPAAALASSPATLHGSVEECVAKLLALRERHGISYLNLGGNLQAAALITAELAGR
jgi:probable F420-dependent oxidoreductase